jgi:XTP/dITP diphosphohydrolase
VEIVLATRNPDKGREIAAMLTGLDVRVRTLGEFPGAPDVVEDGTTCEANAIKKAVSAAQFTRLPAVADDTGLMVDMLNGRPGVYAARYAGEHATYDDNCRKLLRELDGVPKALRTARFVTVAAIAKPTGDKPAVVDGVLDGLIAEQPAGDRGFGYDPIFFVPELNRTLAQLTPDEKNRISHRARAFVKVREILKEL